MWDTSTVYNNKIKEKIMQVVRDLFHGFAPIPLDMYFHTDGAGAGGTVGYKGQLCKVPDGDDVDEGVFVHPSTTATALENLVGILNEDVAAATTYTLDGTDGNPVRKKIIPITNSTLIRAEYGRTDAAGTATTDTGASGSAASQTWTPNSITTADLLIGGWIYFLTGSNAGYLHHVQDNGTTNVTLTTALTYATVSADTFLVIQPPMCRIMDFNATYTGINSEVDDGATTDVVCGLDHWIEAPGHPMQKLDLSIHDGLNVGIYAKFYHDFTIPSAAAGGIAWVSGQSTS
jgi:hypothetical protein